MNSTVSNLFSRDTSLKRRAGIRRKDTSPAKAKSLHIIPEEDEPRASCSSARSPSPLYIRSLSPCGSHTDPKKSRRHASVSSVCDIRIASELQVLPDDFGTMIEPRPAPRPRTHETSPISSPISSPKSSPDPFRLTFTDYAFTFPHPPLPTPSSVSSHEDRSGALSPTPSMSTSSTSSPGSHTTGLPTTPSSSDEEFQLSPILRPFNPRRASIRPLIISKLHTSNLLEGEISDSVSIPEITKGRCEAALSSSPLSLTSEESCYESDPESDSEWYTRELGKILTLRSPLPASFPKNSARPESLSPTTLKLLGVLPSSPTVSRRTSKPLPNTPSNAVASSSRSFPSAQLDPAYPRRHSRGDSISKRAPPPPPPVPPIPAHLRSLSNTSITSMTTDNSSTSSPRSSCENPRARPAQLSLRRPPPRSSIPADCGFFNDDDDDDVLSYYTQPAQALQSAVSAISTESSVYSQASLQDTEVEFDVADIEFDLDIDVPMRLPLSLPNTPIDLEADIASGLEELRLKDGEPQRPIAITAAPSSSSHEDEDAFSGYVSSQEGPARPLRSQWSSSTLSSVKEEHSGLQGASSKLRLYFGGSPKKRGSKSSTASSRKASTLVSPPLSPSKRFRAQQQHPYQHTQRQSRRESDIMVIGYGVRRRGSSSGSSVAASIAGSEDSAASSTSSGLRRKPIPVEMFLRA